MSHRTRGPRLVQAGLGDGLSPGRTRWGACPDALLHESVAWGGLHPWRQPRFPSNCAAQLWRPGPRLPEASRAALHDRPSAGTVGVAPGSGSRSAPPTRQGSPTRSLLECRRSSGHDARSLTVPPVTCRTEALDHSPDRTGQGRATQEVLDYGFHATVAVVVHAGALYRLRP